MARLPTRETVDRVKMMYPAGTRVELVEMEDPYRRLPQGLKGTVKAVDDIGTVHINWDNGCTLGAVYGVDQIRIITEVSK